MTRSELKRRQKQAKKEQERLEKEKERAAQRPAAAATSAEPAKSAAAAEGELSANVRLSRSQMAGAGCGSTFQGPFRYVSVSGSGVACRNCRHTLGHSLQLLSLRRFTEKFRLSWPYQYTIIQFPEACLHPT